jgi:thiol-disulfide isomerase/thioredoxin
LSVTDPIWQAIVLLLVAFAVVQTVVLIGVMRQLGGVLLQLRPARVGELPGQGPEMGLETNIPGLNYGRPGLVLFVAPGCGLCRPLLPAIAALRRAYGEIDVVAAVIGQDEAKRNEYALEVGEGARSDLAHLEKDWNIPGTPYVVAVDRESRTYASGVVNSLDQLDTLADEVIRQIDIADSVVGVPPEAAPDNTNGGRATVSAS